MSPSEAVVSLSVKGAWLTAWLTLSVLNRTISVCLILIVTTVFVHAMHTLNL